MKHLLTLSALAFAGVAAAQGTAIYAPVRVIADQGITVKGWGSGTVSETDETAYEGTHSIRISSRNYFQGGIIKFAKPVNMASAYENDANLLRITFKLSSGNSTVGGGRPGSGPGGPIGPGGIGGTTGPGGRPGGGGPGAGGPPGQGGPAGGRGGLQGGGAAGGAQGGRGGPGLPGQGGPGGFPGGGFPAGGQSAASSLKSLRIIITTSDGKKSEAYIPTDAALPDERGWASVGIPLKAIDGFGRTNKEVQSIAIAPDQTNTFYIGELRILEDTTPIRGEVSPQMLNLGANQEVRLSAIGFGGSSILKYEWDFDSEDGIQVDAEGRSITRRFRKPGEFTITLTITDLYGLKKPYTTTIKAKVNP